MSSPIHIIATVKIKAGKEKEAAPVLKSLIQPTHQEPGCVRYALHQSTQDPRTYYYIEQWRSQEDLQKHLTSSHIAPVIARKDELLDLLHIDVVNPLPLGTPAKEALWG